jgi:acylphosphatase
MITRQIRVTGHVQGVGFRYAIAREAQRHGVRGWVRNRRDGTVEALLQGEADAVRRVVEWARLGPPAARVDTLSERDPEPGLEARCEGFEARPTL